MEARYYALKRARSTGGEPYYIHVYTNRVAVRACMGKHEEHIYEVLLQEDPGGEYYAWFENEDQRFHFVYLDSHSFLACFTNGPEVEEGRGRGRQVRVSLQEKGEA
jgi:hypothetical protein